MIKGLSHESILNYSIHIVIADIVVIVIVKYIE